MADLPDISHLTPEERRIIESVMMRQKQEEEQENEIMRRKQDEVQVLEETIRARSEKHKKAGVELNATCHICLKTKFADGIGHICNYCNIRCCARCGGKVTLRSNKVIWVCILCRKKQELLSKTGQWMTKGAADNAMLRRMQEDMQAVGPGGIVDQTQDKRPKLERAHSAAEKENLPLLQRSGSLLRRQYSQQEQVPGRRMSTSDSGVEMSVSPHSRALPTPHLAVGSYPVTQTPRHPAAYPEDDPSLYRGEIDGLMRQHLQNYQRQRPIYQEQNSDLAMAYGQSTVEGGPSRSAVHPSQQHSIHQTQGVHPNQPAQPGGLQQQRSFSSSEEERSTPECASDEPDESEKGKGYYHHGGGPNSMSSGGRRQNGSHNGHHVAGTVSSEHNGHHPPREPRKEESTLVRRSFRRSGDEWRADSRRFTERRGKKTVRFDGGTNVGGPQEEDWSWEADRQGSQDSATKDSGIDTSSNFTSSEDSNRGDLPKHPLSWQVSRDGQKIIGHMTLRKSPGSGSSSSILGLKVVGGKLLEDGSMGALIEKVKKGSTADIEGQLRPGDEVIKWNGRSLQGKSFREVYDIIAESRQEPQVELVVSRNLSSTSTAPGAVSTMPQGPTPSTPMASRRIGAQTQWRQKHETIAGPQQPHHKELYDARREKPSVLVTSPGSPDLHAQGRGRHPRHPAGNANVGGNIQVKLGFDPVGLQLIVTLVCAAGLTPRSNGQPRNPYAKIFLLPDKSEKSKRRTKTLANTNDPRWNQSFVYNGIRRSELRKRALEITVWDYGRYDANDFLGEAVVELAVSPLDEEPEWHTLTAHGEHRHIGHYPEPDDMVITPVDCHLSPPSTTSRLSDSDTSECDITDCDVSREQRRTADGASISSIGSSSSHYSSPPPERELCVDGEHRSRRDMSPQGRKRAALMSTRDQPASISGYQPYRKEDIHRGMLGHRSHSAAPMDFSSVRYRGRSQSPTGHRSLSPPEHRSMPYSHGYVSTRFGSRSATATPTGSPKKRQLPQIPAALKERVAQDLEERARFIRHRNRQVHTTYRSTGMGGWERHYSGLSDSDLPSMGHDPLSMPHSHAHRMHRPRRGHLSPDKDVLGDLGDSDMESTASITSSAFSTQSERARGSRGLIPTVKNVLIPGVISPMPPPPRRNRRRHRLRVPCSECHCPNNNNNNPTKPARSNNNNPSKHNPTSPHPLVRSKSAVVRSLYRKMRTPFTRSQTVDENMLRYYSPETSEYTVSEGYILKPEELTGSSRKRIPEIYVEDCLQVAFNERLLEKFRSGSYSSSSPYRLESGSTSRRRSRSWQDRTAAGRSSKSRHHHNNYYHHNHRHNFHHNHHHQHNHHQQQHHNLRQHAQHLQQQQQQHHHQQMQQPHILLSSRLGADDLDVVRNVDVSLRPRRSFLFSKARSFDYDVPHDTFGNRFGTRLGAATSGLLSRRAKSFEYETLPSNIFSDDSLRTARRKLKRNLSLSDSGYGDKIPALGDQSKSYWDSNGDDKPPKSLLNREPNYDYLTNPDFLGKPFYGYDSELSAGETEIYVPSFDKQSVETVVEARDYLSSYDDSDHADLTTKRKYTDATAGYLDRDSSFDMIRATEKRTKNLDDHIYCSIDEALSSANNYESDGIGTRIPGIRSDEEYDSELSRRRRRKGIDSYLGSSDYEGYEDWEYDEGFVDRRKIEDYEQTQFEFDDMGDYYREPADHESSRAAASYQRKRTAQFDEPIVDYPRYRSTEGYDYGCAYEDSSSPRRRRRRSRRESREAAVEYENLRPFSRDDRDSREAAMYGKDSLSVPTFFESKRMMLQRAESTPILHSDEDLSSVDRARRLYRRRRNSSCPESRELRMYERGGGVEDERTSHFVFDSEEEFGSMETVVGADYYRRRRAVDEGGGRIDDRSYASSADRAASYVDPRSCEECRECRARDSYRQRREVRSSLRSSQDRYYQSSARDRRKSSCPECREMAAAFEAGAPAELGRSGSLRRGDERRSSFEGRPRYRRRNSSCPEARDLELLDKKYQQHQQEQQYQRQDQQQQQQYHHHQEQQHQQQYQRQDQRQQQERGGQAGTQQRSSSDQAPAQQQGSKRNVAISDTLEYYEYSMESESQCSENCGFGPCDPRRPRNRAPRPGNANSSLFDSQTATSDTAKNYHPRAVDHHENPRNTKTPTTITTRDRHHHHHHHHHHDHGLAPSSSPSTPPPPPPPSGQTTTSSLSSNSARRHSGRKKTVHDGDVDGYIDERRGDDDGRERRSSSMPESSEYSGQSGSYEKQSPSSRHQVTDNGHDEHGKRAQFTRSLSNADVPPDEKADGSLSDTAVGLHVEDAARRGRKSSPGSKSGSGSSSGGGSAAPYQSGLGKKSNSTSQLSATECGVGGMMLSIGGGAMAEARGLGFAGRKRNSTPSSIQRSEEIMPIYQRFDPSKQAGSAASDTAGSLNSISSSEGSSWSPSLRMAGETGQLRDFIEDLGPGQVVGRQALGARCLGEIQLSLSQKKGYLEVEVVRAKDLKAKHGSKVIPASYVKVYLVNGKKCIAKAKTPTARKTLDPFFQRSLVFKENCQGCILQVTVWGDYGRFEGKKVFMGVAQIVLDELDLNQIVFAWYKLFGTTSL